MIFIFHQSLVSLTSEMVGLPAGIPEAPLEDADAAEQFVAIPAFDIQSVAM